MRIPRAHAWPTFFTHQSSLFFSLQVVSKRFSSKNKFTGLICKTATPFVQVWHSKELQKCLLYSLWNAFRKKIFNFYSLIKQFCCYHSAGWVQKKKKRLGTRWRSACIVKYRTSLCLIFSKKMSYLSAPPSQQTLINTQKHLFFNMQTTR